MSKIAVFPGSFDPITIGHENILNRAAPLFDKIYVAIGHNSNKKYLYSLEERLKTLSSVWSENDKVEVSTYQGLTVDYCRELGAQYIIRGLRSSTDFEYEKTIAQLNSSQDADIETIFLMCDPGYSHIHSSVVREIIVHGGDARPFLPLKAHGLL